MQSGQALSTAAWLERYILHFGIYPPIPHMVLGFDFRWLLLDSRGQLDRVGSLCLRSQPVLPLLRPVNPSQTLSHADARIEEAFKAVLTIHHDDLLANEREDLCTTTEVTAKL